MNLSAEFFIGTALAIPLGIVTALLTPKIQLYIDKRSKKAALKRSAELAADLARIETLNNEKGLLREHLLEV